MSGVVSWAAGERTESPTAMMRIAKIADDEGGTEGGGLEAGAGGSPPWATAGDESLRRRGPGGSLRGRGGAAIGAFGVALVSPSAPAASAGCEGVRTLLGALASLLPGIEGLERRRIGGG